MKKILNNWKHTPGIHCGSVAIRDVLNYYNFNYSEEVCFGLGSGLGFYYTVSEVTSPTRSIHLRGPGMEVNFFNHFGAGLTDWSYEDDPGKALDELIDSINNDVPVLIQTDIFYLDYYNSGTHFPGHIVVVCGYDDEREVFYLSDTAFEDIKEVSFKNLIKARNARFLPYPLRNNNIRADLSGRTLDLNKAVPEAIKKNAYLMIDGSENLRGKSGLSIINKWAEDLPNWKDIEDWKWAARFAYQVISRRGVDGAGFRWIYRDFLNEMKNYSPLIGKMGLVAEMDNIGKEWNRLSKELKSISELESVVGQFTSASQTVNGIFTLESKFYNKIAEGFN